MNLSIISILLGRAMITAHIAKLDQTRIEISKCQIVRLGVIACRHPLVQHWMAHCAQAADCNSCSCGSNPNNGRWSPYTYIHLIRPKIIGLNIIILLFCNRVFFDTFLNKQSREHIYAQNIAHRDALFFAKKEPAKKKITCSNTVVRSLLIKNILKMNLLRTLQHCIVCFELQWSMLFKNR